jgi:hypothetical protein
LYYWGPEPSKTGPSVYLGARWPRKLSGRPRRRIIRRPLRVRAKRAGALKGAGASWTSNSILIGVFFQTFCPAQTSILPDLACRLKWLAVGLRFTVAFAMPSRKVLRPLRGIAHRDCGLGLGRK